MRVPICALFLVSCLFCGQLRPTSGANSNNFFKNCEEIKLNGDIESGVRIVYPIEGYANWYSVEVYCDQNTDEGGWTLIQKRDLVPKRENFTRSWSEYAEGFGDIASEFWLGLEHIHALTSSTQMELRVDLEDWEGATRWAKYRIFHVEDAASRYTLRIADYTGDAGDGMAPSYSDALNLNGMKFSTYDEDNDLHSGGNCAGYYRGGWWYNRCFIARLTGLPSVGEGLQGIIWEPFRGRYSSLKKASMKIRPVSKKDTVTKGKIAPTPGGTADTPEEATSASDTKKPVKKLPKNCAELQALNAQLSGVQIVFPYGDHNSRDVVVFCDQETDEGGWTIIQSRSPFPVRENFTRSWSEYEEGFGNLTGEFWLGLRNIHALTSSAQMELRVDLEDDKGQKRWAQYGSFHVGDAASRYTLKIADFSGNAGDGLTYPPDKDFNLNGMKFSAYDEDNDLSSGGNCAKDNHGGWWFNSCYGAHLNGLPIVGEAPFREGILWGPFGGWASSLKKASMKIRPVYSGF